MSIGTISISGSQQVTTRSRADARIADHSTALLPHSRLSSN